MSYLRWSRRRLDVPSWLNSQEFNLLAANQCRGDLELVNYLRAARTRKLNHVSFENALMLEKQYNVPVTLNPSSSVDNLTYLTPREISSYVAGLSRNNLLSSGVQHNDKSFEKWSYHGAYQEFTLATNKVDEFDPTKQTTSAKRVPVKGANIITTEVDPLGNNAFAFHDYNLYKLRLKELFTATTDGNVFVVDGALGYDFNVRAICDNIYVALFYKYLFKKPTPALPRERVVDATIWSCTNYTLPSTKIRYMLDGPTAENLKWGNAKLTLATSQHFIHTTSPISAFSLINEFVADSFHNNQWVASGQQPLVCVNGDLFRKANGKYVLLLHDGATFEEKMSELRRSPQLVGAHLVTLDVGHVSPVYDGTVLPSGSEKEYDVVFQGSHPGTAHKIPQVSGSPDRGYTSSGPVLPSGLPGYTPGPGAVKPLRVSFNELEVYALGEGPVDKFLGESQHYSRRAVDFGQAAANVLSAWKNHESHYGSAELSFRKVHLDNEKKRNEDLAQHVSIIGSKILSENGVNVKFLKEAKDIDQIVK